MSNSLSIADAPSATAPDRLLAKLHRAVTITLVALLFLGLPLSPGLSNTAGALLILWVPLDWKRFSDGIARWPVWLIVAMILPLAAAWLAAIQSLDAGIAPWDAIVAHRKELMFIVLLIALGNEVTQRTAWRAAALGGAIAVILTIAFWATNTSIRHEPFNSVQPVVLSHTFQNFILGFLTVTAITLAFLRPAPVVARILASVICAASLFTIGAIVTGRTGQLATIVMGAVLIFRFAPKRVRIPVIVLCVAALAAAIALSPQVRHRYSMISDDIARYEAGDPVTAVGLRLYYWKASVKLIESRPVLGYGAGSFRTAYDKLLGIDADSSLSTPHPHSDFFYYQVERGVPGLLGLLAVYVALFAMSLRLADPHRSLMQALLAGFIYCSFANSFFLDWASCGFLLSFAALLLVAGRPQNQ